MKIGKYEIIEELGKGGMGAVYKAYDPVIEREVAIKVILEHVLETPNVKERFYREAKALGKLSHENITILHDVGEADGKPYIVMEFLHGTNLRNIIERNEPVPISQKLDYARQICWGLQIAHAHHIIHRDIKPENIMVLDSGRVKIMDFGIAKPEVGTITQTGVMMGTPFYMSPEQVRGQRVDPRSDIFAFGVVLYELLTSQKPFTGENIESVLYNIVHEPPEKLTIAGCDSVNALQNVVSKCLEKNPDQRYGDFAEVIDELTAILERERQSEIKPVKKKPLETVTIGRESGVGRPHIGRRLSSKAIWLTTIVFILLGTSGWLVMNHFKEGNVEARRETSLSPAQQTNSGIPERPEDSADKIQNTVSPGAETKTKSENPNQRVSSDPQKKSTELDVKPSAADLLLDQQKIKAEQARQNMALVKKQMPGREEDKNAEPLYQQALTLESAGNGMFAERNWTSAMTNYNEAEALYSRARDTIAAALKDQKAETEESKRIMAAAKEVATANQRDEDFQKIIDNLKERFKTSIEQGDLAGLRSLYTSFLAPQERQWSSLFQFSKDRRVSLAIGRTDFSGVNPTVELSFRLKYIDNKNREQEITHWYTWTLEQVNGEWKIASVTER